MRKLKRITGKRGSTASASTRQKLNRAKVSTVSASTRQKLARWNLRTAALRREINSINAALKTPITPGWANKLKRDLGRLTEELSTIQTKQKLLGK